MVLLLGLVVLLYRPDCQEPSYFVCVVGRPVAETVRIVLVIIAGALVLSVGLSRADALKRAAEDSVAAIATASDTAAVTQAATLAPGSPAPGVGGPSPEVTRP